MVVVMVQVEMLEVLEVLVEVELMGEVGVLLGGGGAGGERVAAAGEGGEKSRAGARRGAMVEQKAAMHTRLSEPPGCRSGDGR